MCLDRFEETNAGVAEKDAKFGIDLKLAAKAM